MGSVGLEGEGGGDYDCSFIRVLGLGCTVLLALLKSAREPSSGT